MLWKIITDVFVCELQIPWGAEGEYTTFLYRILLKVDFGMDFILLVLNE